MFERFTNRARRVVVYAQEECVLLRHDHIGTEHLLLGLLHEGEGVAARALGSLGVSLQAARAQVGEVAGRGRRPPGGHIPFTGPAKRVLEHSLREARQLGHDHIGTEHLLLGLLREGDATAGRVLVKLGLRLASVRERVLEALRTEGSGQPGGREPPPPGIDELRAEIERLRRLLRRHGIDPDDRAQET